MRRTGRENEDVSAGRSRARLFGLGPVGLVLIAAVSSPLDTGLAKPTALDRAEVTITVRLGVAKSGTFRMTGVAGDAGRVTATRAVSRGTLRTKLRLQGARGVLVVGSTRSCRTGRGTWTVVSGTGSYSAATGGGTVGGALGCTRPWKAATAIHAGRLVLPPPALAPAGMYGGWTPQDEYLDFEVAPSGRSIVGLAVSGFSWDCTNEDGRFALGSKRERMAGPFPIADDRTFTVKLFENITLAGRFSSNGAEGTITIDEYPFTDARGKPVTCGGTIPWAAATPPPSPRRALPGTYCGRTAAGHSACLDVLEGGRELRNFRVTARLFCGDVRFELELTLDETIALGPTLKFEYRYQQSIPGGEPVAANLRGSFDQSGGSTGSLTLARSSFVYEGTRYTCTGGGANWTAQLQR